MEKPNSDLTDAKHDLVEIFFQSARYERPSMDWKPALDSFTTDVIDKCKDPFNALLVKIQAESDAAYIKYLDICKTNGCLGEEFKMTHGIFTSVDLRSHKQAAEMLGKHRALQEIANELLKALSIKVI